MAPHDTPPLPPANDDQSKERVTEGTPDLPGSGLPTATSAATRKRRRRRGSRQGPRPVEVTGFAASGGSSGENIPAEVPSPAPTAIVVDQARKRVRHRRHRRGPRVESSETSPANNGVARARESRAVPRHQGDYTRELRDARSREQGRSGDRWREPPAQTKGPRGSKSRHHTRGRDDSKKPAPKLYSVEAVLDRGFDDVADPANEAATRRVEWTIVKRTIADQRSTKVISANYILKREGVDTEFANLSLARAAVNKTIVHPGKLTRPKAEYAASKKK